jgi:SAM-dependent methyltransferase
MKNCILCKSEKIEVYQIIEFNLLKQVYLQALNIDISSEIKDEDSILVYKCNVCDLEFFDPKNAGSASFYEELQIKRNIYYSPDRKEFKVASDYIKENDSVLEVGSGSGFFAEKIKSKNYVGLEFNDHAIQKAKEIGISLIKESIEDYAKNNQSDYDIVCSFHVLEHVKNPNEFISASLQKLKANGKLIIAVPCDNSVLTSNHNHVLNLPPHHITRWKISTLNKLESIFNLRIVDFRIISISEKINHKNYSRNRFNQKMLNILYPNNKFVISPSKLTKFNRWFGFIFNKFHLHSLYKREEVIGENVLFVFQKK